MRTIIAGSRTILDYDIVCKAIKESGFCITEVVSGCANGVDTLGENWANAQSPKIPIKYFKADWKNIRAKGAVIKRNRYGKYNAVAGLLRNRRMAEYADALICVWDGISTGSKNMIEEARKHNLKVFIYKV